MDRLAAVLIATARCLVRLRYLQPMGDDIEATLHHWTRSHSLLQGADIRLDGAGSGNIASFHVGDHDRGARVDAVGYQICEALEAEGALQESEQFLDGVRGAAASGVMSRSRVEGPVEEDDGCVLKRPGVSRESLRLSHASGGSLQAQILGLPLKQDVKKNGTLHESYKE